MDHIHVFYQSSLACACTRVKSLGKRDPSSCPSHSFRRARSTMASLLKRLQDSFSPPAAVMETVPTPPKHPYYPIESEIVGYLANEYNTLELVSLFAAGCAVIFSCTYMTVKKLRPNVPLSDVLVVLWFTLCGFIHLFFEGYYAYNFRTIGGHQDLFGQLWKEYSLSDSRYLTADSAFVLCMESITAVRTTLHEARILDFNMLRWLGGPCRSSRLRSSQSTTPFVTPSRSLYRSVSSMATSYTTQQACSTRRCWVSPTRGQRQRITGGTLS